MDGAQGEQEKSTVDGAQGEQEKYTVDGLTGGCPEGETFEIENWIDRADGTEEEQSAQWMLLMNGCISALRGHRFFPTGLQQVFVSSPPASPNTGSKLEEVEKIIASLDSRLMFMDSRMISVDSKVHSMDSKLRSMDSKLEQLLNVQTYLKHDFGTYKRSFYDNMDTVAGNVKYCQTSLETTVLHHLTKHQIQLASDLSFVKLQMAELVDHLKQAGVPKRGKVGNVVVDRGKGQVDKGRSELYKRQRTKTEL
ncbi:hypothetical protein F511_40802 [Dorcoceras hygrometricum]|uniref:Uncharacterized protein n=1 Tax=Dorcoceras hygrometricum TaxID=472368 RepID=A0A2Z7D5G3_9LAMI|nr:hypothetical protein F511_40802 [Dorcoceras hygrometricum]